MLPASVKKTLREFNYIANDAQNAVFIKDTESKILYLNKAARLLLGQPLSKLKGKRLSQVFPLPMFRAMESLQKKVILSGKMQEGELEASEKTYLLITFPLHDEKTRSIVGTWGVLRDRKEVRKLQKEVSHLEEVRQVKEEAEEANNRLYRLQYVTTALTRAVDSKEIAQIMVTLGAASLHTKLGTVWLYDAAQHLYLAASAGFEKGVLEKIPSVRSKASTPTLDAIKKKKVILLRSLEDRKKLYPHTHSFVKDTGMQGFIAIPLVSQGRIFGAVNFAFNAQKEFSIQEQEFVQSLVEQCVQALERARLYEEELLQKEKLRKTVERLSALHEISLSLSQELSPEKVAHNTLKHAIQIMNAEAGEVAILSPDQKKFKVIASLGYSNNFLNKWTDISGQSEPFFMWDMVKKNNPFYISTIEEIPKKYKMAREFYLKTHLKMHAIIPLSVKHILVGGMLIFFKHNENFNNEDKAFLETLTQQIAHALERASIYHELEKREARFRSLIENSIDAIVLINVRGEILYASPSTKRVTGYSAEERLGKDVLKTIYPQDKILVKNFIARLTTAKPGENLKLRYRRVNKDGSTPWMEAVGSNQLHSPEINALVVNYHNINEEVRGEEDLKRAKEELEIILQNVADGVIVRGPNGKVIFANQAAVILNRDASLEDFIGTKSNEYVASRFEHKYNLEGKELSPEDLPTYQAQHGKRGLITMVMRVVFRDTKEEQWRRVKTTGVYNAQNKLQFIITVFQDVTQEIEEQQLKDEFISIASHELKTPITSAKLYTQLLQKHATSTRDEKGYLLLGKVDRQLNRLTKLIKDLLNVSRIRSGSLGIHPEVCSIQKLVEETVEEMQYTTITHTLYLQGTSQHSVHIDKERIRQVLVNLISNAIKYSPQAKKVDISIVDGEKEVSVSVRDYGIGIRKENQERIFYPFFRGVHRNAQRFPGLGLGLHIASEIVKRHNGSIKVDSTLDKGSIFTLTLPVKK